MRQNKTVYQQTITFRRWNSKSYSVFNSLKRAIRIGVLLMVYLRFANYTVVFAQETPDTSYQRIELDEIDIVSEHSETTSALSRVVAVITKAEIEQASVSSINELLEYASNIDIRQRGTSGIQADISIRGGTFDQSLVLLNGINISDPQTGHHQLNIPVDLSAIKRIEILKGPGAWKFGPGAFSGAINIITDIAKADYIEAGVDFGQYAYNKEKINSGFRLGNTAHILSGMYSSTKGYTENTDNRQATLYYMTKLHTKKGEASLQAGYSDKSFGANSFYTAKYPNQYEEVQTSFASVSYNARVKKIYFEPAAYFRMANDRFLLFRDAPGLYSNYHTTHVFGLKGTSTWFHNLNSITIVGIDSRTESIFSNSLGEVAEEPVYSPVNDTILLDHYHSRTTFSAFIGHKRYFSSLMVNAGLNVTYNSDIVSRVFFFPGIDLNYSFNKELSLFASVNKTMRMPTFTDLYYRGPNNTGNPALLPEEAMGYELGLKYISDVITGNAAVFYTQGKNLIDWVKNNVEDPWRTENYSTLNTLGAEASLKFNLYKMLPGQSFFKQVNVQYTHLDQQKPETDIISNYSLNYLRHRIDITVLHSVIKNVYVNWHFAYQDRNGQYEKIVKGQSLGLVDFEPFFTTDFKIYWEFKGWQASCSINNLFDVDYYDIGNVPQPGRWVRFGLFKKLHF
ncbi:MAG: TonB-dependent receptor [Prolixibacteraceae bacterium]|nr:TonB-dependent receptor [Prolixibacteraceae bacterium]